MMGGSEDASVTSLNFAFGFWQVFFIVVKSLYKIIRISGV